MPRYRATQDADLDPTLRDELVNKLAHELRVDGNGGMPRQPFIFEQEVPQTGTYHVIVIWERWNEVPSEQRASIIMDAYERVEPLLVPNLTVVVGATMEEAIEMNLLPYQIITTRKNTDAIPPADLRLAMLDEGAIESTTGLELRFPTLKMAQDAYARLSNRVPGPYWAITRTLSRAED